MKLERKSARTHLGPERVPHVSSLASIKLRQLTCMAAAVTYQPPDKPYQDNGYDAVRAPDVECVSAELHGALLTLPARLVGLARAQLRLQS